MTTGPKNCPIPANARSKAPAIQDGPWTVGSTQMMLGNRQARYWNPTTKQFEYMTRPGISEGTNGGKRFIFGPSKLI